MPNGAAAAAILGAGIGCGTLGVLAFPVMHLTRWAAY